MLRTGFSNKKRKQCIQRQMRRSMRDFDDAEMKLEGIKKHGYRARPPTDE